MLKDSEVFSSFSVNDLAAAKEFYSQKLGLDVSEDEMGLKLNVVQTNPVMIYTKADHVPATFTILNFSVSDINAAVSELASNGVTFEQYDWGNGAKTDEKGIMHGKAAGQGPDIAWFKDPAGNVLSVLQN